MNLSEPNTSIQIESMDTRLRNKLWNLVYDLIGISDDPNLKWPNIYGYKLELIQALHTNLFGNTADSIQKRPYLWLASFRKFFHESSWNRVYDTVEFIIDFFGKTHIESDFNNVLKSELSGYRSINFRIVPISNNTEIGSIQESLKCNINGVVTHIAAALEALSKKESPDLRATIRESIHAVECAAKHVAGSPKATLGDALKKIDNLHPALHKAYSSLYGWTNDAEGIRHAILDDAVTLDVDLAKYFLVSCSAFANYLISLDQSPD